MSKMNKQEVEDLRARRKARTEALRLRVDSVIENSMESKHAYMDWLRFNLKCSHYSFSNRQLLYGRFEEPVVKTFNGWKKEGIFVKKGARAAYILAPNKHVLFHREDGWHSLKEATPAEKAKIEAGQLNTRSWTAYRPMPVFDISQTNADIEEILLIRQQAAPKNPTLREALDAQEMDEKELLACLRNAVKYYGQQQCYASDKLTDLYEAGTLFLCGERLKMDSQVNDFHLLHNIHEQDLPDLKKVMRDMIADSEEIVNNLL